MSFEGEFHGTAHLLFLAILWRYQEMSFLRTFPHASSGINRSTLTSVILSGQRVSSTFNRYIDLMESEKKWSTDTTQILQTALSSVFSFSTARVFKSSKNLRTLSKFEAPVEWAPERRYETQYHNESPPYKICHPRELTSALFASLLCSLGGPVSSVGIATD